MVNFWEPIRPTRLYLSTIWYDNRTKEVDAVNFVKATQQSGVTAAQLAAGDAELMEKPLDCNDVVASGGSRLTYPFSQYRPFYFWERSHIDMLSSRGLLSKSKPSDQLQLLYGAPIVSFEPIQVEGLDVVIRTNVLQVKGIDARKKPLSVI